MAGVVIVDDVVDEDVLTPRLSEEPRPKGPAAFRLLADYPTIRAAVDAARPHVVMLIETGVCHATVLNSL